MEVVEIAAPMHNGLVNGHSGYGEFNDVVAPVAEQQDEFSPAEPQQTQTTSTAPASSAAVAPASDVPKQPRAAKKRAAPGKTARQNPPERTSSRPPKGDTHSAEASEPPVARVKYAPQAQLDAELARLEQMSQAALAGDTTALDRLRTELDRVPHVWRRLADIQYLVELKLAELVVSNDPLRNEAIRKRYAELRDRLIDDERASLATRMAASRVVACWYFAQLMELRALESPAELRNIKQLEQAERRYQTAMRTFLMARQSDLQLRQLAQ